jgi:uncharacterized NAD(P)/FAD-binding protein YdhS
MVKRLVDAGHPELKITIFEKNNQLGAGMPYSHLGANDEHVTNVSDNEYQNLLLQFPSGSKPFLRTR